MTLLSGMTVNPFAFCCIMAIALQCKVCVCTHLSTVLRHKKYVNTNEHYVMFPDGSTMYNFNEAMELAIESLKPQIKAVPGIIVGGRRLLYQCLGELEEFANQYEHTT